MIGLAQGVLIGLVVSAWLQTIAVILLIGEPRTGTYTSAMALGYLVFAVIVSLAVWIVLTHR